MYPAHLPLVTEFALPFVPPGGLGSHAADAFATGPGPGHRTNARVLGTPLTKQ